MRGGGTGGVLSFFYFEDPQIPSNKQLHIYMQKYVISMHAHARRPNTYIMSSPPTPS